MSLRYALIREQLITDPNDHAAQVQITGSAGVEQIAELKSKVKADGIQLHCWGRLMDRPGGLM
ncbi:MAG: hypothetical protein H0W86_03755 [Armatimonadetes bacterium]|nr:hypothetical protein [Armatimonadota bacterium]